MAEQAASPGLGELGDEMYRLAERLYPIPRSLTGHGVRQSLRELRTVAPIQMLEVPTGTAVLDWTVPKEWNVKEAWIADPAGNRVVDVRRSSLHLVGYSVPLRARMSLTELRTHLHTLPEHPAWIPYRTSYYRAGWGFCLSQDQLDSLPEGDYEVCIDAALEPGHLTYGELVLPGTSSEEILISAHICHPSLADDNVSGLVVAAFLARHFAARPRQLTLRFLFAPGTIGAITWLALHRVEAARIRHGLTLVCLGDSRPLTYKRTFSGTAEIDGVVPHVLAAAGVPHEVVDFSPYGYDERQYSSPGFRIPVGSLMRARHGRFPEYHTSADDLAFISGDRLAESFTAVASIVEALDGDRRYRNLAPHGEPQLGRRGLYHDIGGVDIAELEHAMLWVLSLSDGDHGLLDIAYRSLIDVATLRRAAELLEKHQLLARI